MLTIYIQMLAVIIHVYYLIWCVHENKEILEIEYEKNSICCKRYGDGGLQKVTSVIADSLASKFEVSILSMK